MTINKFANVAAAAAQTTDMTKAQAGGDFTPLAAGPARARFVGYIETGRQLGKFQGTETKKLKAILLFEISGPKHPPREFDGKKIPNVIAVKLDYSLSAKSHFFRVAQMLNWEGKAKHLAELLGTAYKVTVYHRKYKIGEKEFTDVQLQDPASKAWSFQPPRYEIVNEEGPTGEMAELKVDAPLSDLRCFIWDHADMEQWASLFIEGEIAEQKNEKGEVTRKAKSRNIYQNAIKSALNFKDSPIYTLLLNNGQPLDIPDAETEIEEDSEGEVGESKPATPAVQKPAVSADDALAGIV